MERRAILACLLAMLPGLGYAGELVVRTLDADGKPVADALVTVRARSGQPEPAQAAPVQRTVDQRKLTFLPYLQAARPGDAIVFRNSDRTYHHVYSFSPVRAFDFVLGPGQSSPPLQLEKDGVIAVGCNIHDPMIAYIYVTDAPRVAQTAATGRVAFADLPPGDYEVRAWQPRLRPGKPVPRQVVSVGPKATSIDLALALLPDPRRRVDRERVHY